jgi:cystathionine gamma-synthase
MYDTTITNSNPEEAMMGSPTERGPAMATRLAHGGCSPEAATGAVVPPIYPSTTFARGPDYELPADFVYARYGTPNGRMVENLVAELDGGADSLLFSSGLAAMTALFETVPSGAHVVAPRVMYHGGQDWLRRISERRAIGLTLYEPAERGDLEAALRPGETAIVWIESLLNPSWEVVDIEATASLTHEAGARLAVDSTVSPPVTTRPIDLGADIVMHSATKYLNGHSDVLAGVLTTARDDEAWAEIRTIRTLQGGVPGAFEAWLLLRGMRTLALRFERASSNALFIAEALVSHDAVETVLYPGLASHPTHEVARRQMTGGYGGMMSLLLHGGADAARTVARSTRVFLPATSLGGVESLIEHRATVEGPHSVVPPNLLRLTVGIEDPEDLLADLCRALDGAAA